MKSAQNSLQNSSQESGFTLIELLIVIVIIGVLAGVVATILNPAEYLAQTRDAHRINDMLTVQTAIINALTTNDIQLTDTAACGDCNSGTGTTAIDGSGWVRFTNLNGNGLGGFTPVLPKDPVNENNLVFSYFSDGNTFELNAVLESEKYAEYMVDDGGNNDAVYERGFDLTLN